MLGLLEEVTRVSVEAARAGVANGPIRDSTAAESTNAAISGRRKRPHTRETTALINTPKRPIPGEPPPDNAACFQRAQIRFSIYTMTTMGVQSVIPLMLAAIAPRIVRPMKRDRYALKPDATGWTIFDTATGAPAQIDGCLQTGLAIGYDDLVDLLGSIAEQAGASTHH